MGQAGGKERMGVGPKAQVIKEAKAGGRSVHFGSLMELCHIKTSQLGK